eukprot:7299952-Prymnesium_polylepis.1
MWQFAIWLRQLGLFSVSLALQLVLDRVDPFAQPQAYSALYCSFAAAAAAVVGASAAAHARKQPFAYREQNALESILFACDFARLGLGVANAAFLDAAGEHAAGWAQSLFEGALFAAILGSLAIAAVALVRGWMRSAHDASDSSDVLTAADGRIDEPLCARLRDESIWLLRCSWLVTQDFDVLPRRQELPAEAFFSGAEAAELLARGDRSVLVLSYGWQARARLWRA